MKHTLKWLLLLLALASPAGAQTIAGAAGNLLISCNAITASTSANPGTSAGCLAIAMPSPNGQLPAAFTWQTLTTGGPASVGVNFMGSLDGTTWSQLDTSTNTSGEIRSVSGKPMRFVGCVPATLTGGTAPTITCQLTVTTAGTGGGGTGAGTVTTSGIPAPPNLAAFSSATAITNATAHNVSVPLACAAASASGTAYTCTTSPTFVPADGDAINFEADVANTGAATLNVNGSSAAPITKPIGGINTALAANDIRAGQDCILIFDSANWQMQCPIGNAAAGGISGATPANELIGITATTATTSPARVYLSQTTGTNGNDYCDKVNAAFTTRTNGAIVVGDIQGNQHCSALTAANMFANCNNGYLQMQDTQLYIDFQNQIPPIIQIGNKCGGIRGIGRGDKGGAGTSINACTGAGIGHASCLAPTSRSLTINSMTVSGNYVDVNYTLVNGPPPLAGELVQITGVGVLSITSWTITGANTFTAQAANSGTSALTVGQQVVINDLTHGSYLNGQTLTIASRSATQFTATFSHANDSFTEAGFASPVNNNMFRIGAKAGSGQAVTNDPNVPFNPTSTDFYIVCPACTTIGAIGTAYLGTALVGIFTTGLNSSAITRTLTSVNTAGVYQCSNCGSDVAGQFIGYTLNITGFTNSGNNISGVITANSTTAITLGNVTTINETHAGTATLPAGNFSFGERIENLSINCGEGGGSVIAGLRGCSDEQNINGEEQSGWNYTVATGSTFSGWDVHGNFAQNSGPYASNEVYVGGDTCEEGTIAAFFADSTIAPVTKQTFTASSCGVTNSVVPNIGWLIDQPNTAYIATHPEGYWIGYEVGQDLGVQGDVFMTNGGQPAAHPGNTAIDISANFCGAATPTSDITIIGQKQNLGATNIIFDHCRSTTPITDSFVGLYTWDFNTPLLNFLTTSTHQPNELDSGLNIFQSGHLSFKGTSGAAFDIFSNTTGGTLNLGSNASVTAAGALSLGSGPPSCGTGVTGAFCLGGASTAITPAVGMQGCQADSVTNVLQCSFNNLGLAPLFPSQGVNAQSGAGYTILLTEYGKLISVSNAGAQTVTLPATAPFNGWYVDIENTGAGTWTVSRNGLNIDGGTTNPSLTQNQGVRVLSNGSNYFTQRGIGGNGGVTSFSGDGALISNSGSTGAVTATLGAAAANTFFGNDTAGSTTPSYQKIGTSSTSVNWYIAGGGTAQAQTATLSPAARALTAGLVVHWLPTAANTAASPTLAVNGLTATAITKCGTAALIASDLTTTAIAEAFYDGTQFELLNPQARACGILAPVTNTTAVTVNNPTISTDTEMMELTLPTNYLNTVGQPFLIRAGGVFSTTAASAPQVTITAKLCSVSGCGSGTVTPLGAIQAGAASATAATNNSWAYDLVGAVNANGASCNLVVKGDPGLIIDLSNVASAADSIYADPNTGNSSPNQNCANSLFLGFFVQQSATGASNSYKQLIGAIMPTSGSGAGGGGTTSTQYAFWNPGGLAGTTAGTTAAANTTRLWGFSLPATITSSAGVCYYVATADNTANLYSISLYDHNGALIVSTGALAGTTLFPSTTFKCASWSAPTTVVGGDGNPTYFALTAGATGTAVIGENSSNMTFVAAVLAAGCTPSGGVACTPITPPTATWQAGQSANFGIHQ